jgi:SAM-dependent methyltransferase
MNPYRQRVLAMMRQMLDPLPTPRTVLDFGCGDGWFATNMREAWPGSSLTPVDVKHRQECLVEPLIYDGGNLPFASGQFDLTYAIDVLHHCADPLASLHDVMRCTGRYLLLKDHVSFSAWDRFVLGVLDELGNRRFGIPSPYAYQRSWSWAEEIEAAGFVRISWIHPAPCHTGFLGSATNRLQFIGLWERTSCR